MTPIPPAELGQVPEMLLSIVVEYRDTRHGRCFVTIRPGDPVDVLYESGSRFRHTPGTVDYEAFDRAVRNIAGIPQQETIGPLEIGGRAAPGAGSGSSGRHDKEMQ